MGGRNSKSAEPARETREAPATQTWPTHQPQAYRPPAAVVPRHQPHYTHTTVTGMYHVIIIERIWDKYVIGMRQ